MKTIFFTLKPPQGSYGGGAFFVKNLSKFLIENGYRVVYNLQIGIDLIIIIDPRRDQYNRYSIDDIIKYKIENPSVRIIHRVNECDIKRQRSIGIEKLLLQAMRIADIVVFVSEWLRNYYLTKYTININSIAILNGVERKIFYKKNKPKNDKIKLITHHWSNDWLKGFHIYNEIDKLLNKQCDFEFIYIGNYNKSYIPKNIKLLPPRSGDELGKMIRSCDIYITATQNEPGAMHYLEGMSCGLPVLYCSGGGGAREICKFGGEEYTDIPSLLKKIDVIKNNYISYQNKIPYEKLESKRCCNDYYKVIKKLL